MQIVAFANQKGGVGKTTSAVNSAVVLASRGYRTLLLDLDPQGNATSSLGIDKADLDLSMYDVMLDETAIEDARLRSVRENLDVVPTTSGLLKLELLLDPVGREVFRWRRGG